MLQFQLVLCQLNLKLSLSSESTRDYLNDLDQIPCEVPCELGYSSSSSLDQIEDDLSALLVKISQQLSDGQETESIQRRIENISNSYHKKRVANMIWSIQELLDKYSHECNDIHNEIVDTYKSKFESRNELIAQGRCNFVSSLFESIHASLLQSKSSMTLVLDELVRLKDKIAEIESAREIEDFLVERTNELSIGQLGTILEAFKKDLNNQSCSLKTFLDNKNPSSVSDVFQFVFGSLTNQNDGGSQLYLMDEIFKLLKEEVK